MQNHTPTLLIDDDSVDAMMVMGAKQVLKNKWKWTFHELPDGN